MALKFGSHESFSRDESRNSDMVAAVTPQYLVVCEDFFECELEGDFHDNATPCLWFKVGSKRLITNDSTGELSGDGRIICSDPTICMKYGSWAPLIQDYLYAGKNVTKMGIRRLSSINGTKVVIQAIDYETCLMKMYQQKDDTIEFTFSAISAQDVITMYDDAGTKVGNIGTKFNFVTEVLTPIS
ncbi:hypothetical protein FACS189449_12440 [Alphaproteobacteria bacterium]|nr:hypothetical protein FACS189449_12440 [Alphaproteobacteria bacterium]